MSGSRTTKIKDITITNYDLGEFRFQVDQFVEDTDGVVHKIGSTLKKIEPNVPVDGGGYTDADVTEEDAKIQAIAGLLWTDAVKAAHLAAQPAN